MEKTKKKLQYQQTKNHKKTERPSAKKNKAETDVICYICQETYLNSVFVTAELIHRF